MIAAFGKALSTKLEALTASLNVTVRPGAHPPTDPVPLVSWLKEGHEQITAHDERDGKQGLSGAGYIDVDVEVYDTDPTRRDRVVDLILGTRAAPGITGVRMWLPDPADPERVGVQACELVPDSLQDDYEQPDDGSETRWYVTNFTLKFHCVLED